MEFVRFFTKPTQYLEFECDHKIFVGYIYSRIFKSEWQIVLTVHHPLVVAKVGILYWVKMMRKLRETGVLVNLLVL